MDKRTKRTQDSKKIMLEALEISLGIVTEACEKTKLSRTQHYKWIKEDEEYRKAVNEIENKFIDFAETHLKKQIANGSTQATIFYLKTKGKKRGYVEKSELDLNTGDNPFKVNVNIKGVDY